MQSPKTIRQRAAAALVAGVGGALATAVSFGKDVYDAANPEPVARVAAGEPIDTGRWIVTVEGARAGDLPPTGVAPPEPKRFVMVEFVLDNRSAASAFPSARLLALDPPVEGLPDPDFYLLRDRWVAGAVHPGIPERLVAAWEWPQGVAVPKLLKLSVASQIYKTRDNLYGASSWFDREPAAVVELTVAEDAGEAGR